MFEIQQYKKKDHRPAVASITDIARQKCRSMRDMMTIKKVSRKEIKQMVGMAILQYVSSDILPLTATHVQMIVDWIVSDYNPETSEGGCLGYSIEDVHLVFKKGLMGHFGKPSGHKYVMPEITGRGGWFDQYDTLRNIELGSYYQAINKKKMETSYLPSPKDIPCPPELKIDMSKIGKVERKKYKSIEEFCQEKAYVYEEVMEPYLERWKAEFLEKNPNGAWLKEYISHQKVKMLKRINNAPLKDQRPAKRDQRKYNTAKRGTR